MTRKIFLSYCHRDDQPFGPRDLRWVEIFEKALLETLGQRLGPGRVEVWRDKRRLTGATRFDEEIRVQLDAADLLITILSRHYLESSYCREELQRFGEQRLQVGHASQRHLSRILKVYRAAIDRSDLRRFAELPALVSEIDGTTGYLVYCTDANGEDRDALLAPGGMELVWQKADDLARTVKGILDEASAGSTPDVPDGSRPVVYLARTASDMRDARDALRRELEDRGHTVLPVAEAADDPVAYAAALEADLARAQLSVHLLGERFGALLEGSAESGVSLQARQALARRSDGLRTLLWSPPDAPRREPALASLLHELTALALPAHRFEHVTGSLDELKSLVRTRLAPTPVVAAGLVGTEAAGGGIYLVCDPLDRDASRSLKTALEAQGFSVTRPATDGSPEELLEDHKSCLVACDAAVVLWGQARETWVRSKLRDMQQAPGWGRKTPFLAKIVVVGPPDTPAKQDFDPPPGVRVVPAAEVPAALLPLLQ